MIIRHSAGSYPIVFTSLAVALEHFGSEVLLLTDENLNAAYQGPLERFNRKISIPPGESSKSLEQFGEVVENMVRSGIHRKDTLLVFGGGVVGDLGGFIAATFMRGLRYFQLPTSLLAMVDSSVGGKVGVDLPSGKNMIGAFRPPEAVYVCAELLNTLPEREFRNGMAEVLKYGFIMDRELADQLRTAPMLALESRTPDIVQRCISHKAEVVERDEFETSGLRATLNFGHTVGHAIESALVYESLLHGEAISIGMVVESRIGEILGVSPNGTADSVEETLSRHGLPTRVPQGLDPNNLIQKMRSDKKAGREGIALALLQGVGACKLHLGVREDAISDAIHEYRAH